MPTVLFFRPDEDVALTYGKEWLLAGLQEARRRGFNVIDLVDEDCTFENLKQKIETEQPEVVIALGHGSSTTFTGSEMQIVFRACTGDEIMRGTMSFFVSCSVGQILLPSIVSKNGVWTIGYQVDFQFLISPAEAVEPFKDINVAIITAILEGGKLKGIWDAGIAKGEEWKEKLWNRPEMWCAEAIQLIDHDIHGLIGLGDEEEYLLPPILRAGCFIATAAYGTPLAPQLNVLRRFRERCLPQKIVDFYYATSPRLAEWIGNHRNIRRTIASLLNVLIRIIEA